jgi:SAM-dependent methyltransferase
LAASDLAEPRAAARTTNSGDPPDRSEMSQETINRSTYHRAKLTRLYVQAVLHTPEVLLFVKYRDAIVGKRVLDIGCGAGRTAVYLSRWAGQYTAVDYSSEMLERARAWLPGVRFLECDARDMTGFGDGQFDAAFFLNNGLDSLDHEGRLRALAEIRRVLVPGGLYFFSSHNRDHKDARLQPRLSLTVDPFLMARRVARFHRCLRNRRRHRAYEREEREYAIINDRSHNYSLVTYYTRPVDQASQLRAAGFEPLEAYCLNGEPIPFDHTDAECAWINYVARRL